MGESMGKRVMLEREALRLSAAEFAALAGVTERRLHAIETDQEGARLHELGVFSRFFGVDLAGWDPDEEEEPRPLPGVTTLLKSAEGFIAREDWSNVMDIAEVARDITLLERCLGLPDRMETLRRRWQPDGRIGDPAWPDGQRLAQSLHADATLLEGGRFPESVRGLCERLGIVVIESFLPEGVDALCFADDHHGPAIVVDVSVPVQVLRFRIAHEVCHVLFDRPALEPLQHFDRFDRRRGKDKAPVEQRADAFAIHLLAPEPAVRRCWQESSDHNRSPAGRVRDAMERFGVSFQAMYAHANNLGLLSSEEARALSSVGGRALTRYEELEREPTADDLFAPLARERRGRLLGLTLLALSKKAITTSRALELLAIDGNTLGRARGAWADALGIAQ